MRKLKNFTSLLIATTMMISALSVNVYADFEDLSSITKNNIALTSATDMSLELGTDDLPNFELPETAEMICISELYDVSLAEEVTETENHPPVAGLTNMVSNPDTLADGEMTTETIVYWLWNDGETAYSYDPDGDALVNYYVDGINDYILGNVTIGDEVVGFATQITVAAEYELLFQVEDSNGAFSNIVYLTFPVEPADGNTRPVCSVTVSDHTPANTDEVVFSWGNSYDPDGDTFSGVQVRVFDSTGTYQNVTASSPYYVSMSGGGIILQFTNTGMYEVWISLSDSKNAWSDWYIIALDVHEEYVLSNLNLSSNDHNNSYLTGFDWMNYSESIELAQETNNPDALYESLKQTTVPTQFRNRTILGLNWSISGYVKTTDGDAVSNEKVYISVPMFNTTFVAEATTDTNGYFSYQCNKEKWYTGLGVDEADLSNVIVGFINYTPQWVRYGNYYTMAWLVNRTLTVSCNEVNSTTTFPVVATAASGYEQYLGDKWYRNTEVEEWDVISW